MGADRVLQPRPLSPDRPTALSDGLGALLRPLLRAAARIPHRQRQRHATGVRPTPPSVRPPRIRRDRAAGKLADGARPSPSTPGPSRPATKPSRPPITTRTRATGTGELPNHCEFRAARARNGAPCRHAAMLAMESGVPFWVEQQAYDPCPRLSPRQELEVRRLQPSSPTELGRAVRPLDVHLGG